MKYRGWIAFSGLIWLVIGSMLLYKGLQFLADSSTPSIPNVTENLDLGPSQNPGAERSQVVRISNTDDVEIAPAAGVFASARNQIFSHVRYKSTFVAIGLLIGFFKGRFILAKTVRRIAMRIFSLPLPIRMKDLYPRSYYFLILGMMGLGFSFRFLPIPLEFRGMIDVAIGSALVNGALLYFRATYDKNFLFQSQGLGKAARPKPDGSFDA